MLEIFGILATLSVFVSFLFKDVKLIRGLNLFGSICFVVYGFGIGATWTGVLNFALIFVQLYHLYKLSKKS